MTDPLEALHAPVVPVDPDPVFAARLRDRLRRALLHHTGDTMTIAHEASPRVRTLTPYLCVDDGTRALRWYADAFGARVLGEPTLMEDGRVGHAELAIGDSVFMLADEWPELGLLGPKARGGPSQSLYLAVPDVDVVFARAVEAGAEPARPVADYPHGRNGVVNDPFGHRWMITTPPEPPRPRLRQGDIGYASVWVPDVERAAAFYGSVLGWRSVPAGGAAGRQVEGLPQQHIGLQGGRAERTTFLSFPVKDIQETVRRIREAGGDAEEPTHEPYGQSAMCADDQGMPFSIYQPPESTSPVEARLSEIIETATGHGEISYFTLGFPDASRARSFYGAVLGWEFTPGHSPDGWDVRLGGAAVHPMTGLYGGAERPVVVPMYSVNDIDAAVTRVRDAGGTSTDPTRQPYGLTAECADDQGSRFYLGQH
ncbi:VOC family protein [Actinomadura roseirufa]|uniref:VOC family protein n=1 Tax=Actinomadura roseirufa TaxID=2094049 RepID=UPI0013F15B83|nr:VOC family protein [Actinomadura roseirufa]